jgi:ATP/maltotriose-dependent transcriptional regulator MalT/DNA-binding SARP family transcriptional activator
MVIRPHLSKKSLIPQRQLNTIRRNHLIELLQKGTQRKVTIINAPPGSGKTTLLTTFADEADFPLCWYTMNISDNDVRSLVEGLIDAFSQKFPQIRQVVTDALESLPQPERHVDSIIDSLNHEIHLKIPENITLILEDFHILEEGVTKNIINRLIEQSPENCHFIITSRNQVTLPIVAKLGMHQQVFHINAHQFAFSVREIQELFTVAFAADLTQEQAIKLLEETSWWVPALLLNGVSGNNNLTKKLQCLTQEDLYSYLAEEVFQSQPEETRAFLSNTAILDELIPEFCDMLLAIRNSSQILEELCLKNLFVTRLEGEKQNYRYHAVLKDFLIHQLETKDVEHLLVLHYKAGRIFEMEQQWDEAIHHFIKARKPAEACRIILSIGDDYIRNGKWSTLLSWLDRLPKTHLIASTELQLIKAAALVHTGNSIEAARILTTLLDKKAYGSNTLLQAKLLNWRCAALRMMGQFGEAKRDIKIAIALLKGKDNPPDLKGDFYRRYGDVCAEQGQFKGALRYQKAALKYYSVSHNLALISQVHNSLGIIFKRIGDMRTALYHLENAREGWQKIGNYSDLSITLNNIAIIYQRKGQYEMALETLKTGLEASKKRGYKRTEACLLLTTGEVLRDAGQYKDSLKSFQQGLDIAREVMEPYFVTYALLGMGEVERLIGNTDKAIILLNEASLQAEHHGQFYEIALIKIQVALIENEYGRIDNATKILNQSRVYLTQAGDNDALAKVYFYLTHLAFLNKKYDEMTFFIDKLETIVREIGDIEFLVPICKHAILLLQYCVNKRIGISFFPLMLEKIKHNSTNSITQPTRFNEKSVINNMTSVRITSFGEIKVCVNDREIDDEEWRSLRAKEILLFLLTTNSEKTREQVTVALWPDLSPDRASSNFHINLHRARQAIMPMIFIQNRGKYCINPEINIYFDLFNFQKLIKTSKESHTSSDKINYLEKVVKLYRGSFAPEIDGDWVEAIRQSTESEYCRSLFLLADLYSQQNDHLKAILTLERLIKYDIYNDEAYSRIMELQMTCNDIIGAKSTYQQYCQIVAKETNIISERINRVYQKLTKITH